LVAGGVDSPYDTYHNACELYDPATGSWSYTDSMNYLRGKIGLALLQDGSVLVAGGYAGGASELKTCEIFSYPATETGWSNVESSMQEMVLLPPVVHSEPPVTSGTANTVAWDPVANADEYYAECSDDENFNNIVASSSWISQSSYEFDSLTSGETYWYSVRARENSTWSQTTQMQFSINDLTGVNVTTGGDVVLGSSGGGILDVFVYGVSSTAGNQFVSDLINMGHTVTHSDTFPSNPSLFDVIIITLTST